jgi:hypothetical protein
MLSQRPRDVLCTSRRLTGHGGFLVVAQHGFVGVALAGRQWQVVAVGSESSCGSGGRAVALSGQQQCNACMAALLGREGGSVCAAVLRGSGGASGAGRDD